jgi:hypothetical protein
MQKYTNAALVLVAIAVPFGIPLALAFAAWRSRKPKGTQS